MRQRNSFYQRLSIEAQEINDARIPNLQFSPINDNMKEWLLIITGPENSPYEGGTFFVKISFTENYPLQPPIVKFKTVTFHCNVDQNGDVNVESLLSRTWSPVIQLKSLVVQIVEMFQKPIITNACNKQIAKLYIEDRQKYDVIAKQWTKEFACL
eukprot:TRINITY_DN4972_c0_g1_i2.p2 TRINITY_DN4972_c0_g1~~TRINITY_DN4972_c0_g1_i2.p2  ORF type:complete len:182 (+),score=8.07 TRINITY_DN4972_c0_g1_i2:83-547(+)